MLSGAIIRAIIIIITNTVVLFQKEALMYVTRLEVELWFVLF